MFAIQSMATREISGGYYGTYPMVYQANRERPSNSGRPAAGGPAAELPGWNVRPGPGSNAYGSGWGEENDGMG
ncbi:hypothetical protein [Herbaspirillum sp. YR522]|uniref:hypothetical protein n=1 Tax=Herbaspirillum sp. YR522 TaxID=1144342 RepID=UPI00026F6503|nr:hypothetical protein [Herbaspirillum sp. YR522]EJN07173.1 hypothetical protein PMI40_01955 [Herbaspirillum sp. YR522]